MTKKPADKKIGALHRSVKLTFAITRILMWFLDLRKKKLRWFTALFALAFFAMPIYSLWAEDWFWCKIFGSILLGFIALFTAFDSLFDKNKIESQYQVEPRKEAMTSNWQRIQNMKCLTCKHVGAFNTFEWHFTTLKVEERGKIQCTGTACPNCKSGRVEFVDSEIVTKDETSNS